MHLPDSPLEDRLMLAGSVKVRASVDQLANNAVLLEVLLIGVATTYNPEYPVANTHI